MLVGYILSIVCIKCSQFSRLPTLLSSQYVAVVCVELVHSSLADREDIFITYLIIIIKSGVSIFPIVVTLCRCCGVCLKWLYHHMLSISYTYVYIESHIYIYIYIYINRAVLWCVQIMEYIMSRWSYFRFFAHRITSLSPLYTPIWKYWTSKMLVNYILSPVCVKD